MPLPMLAAAAPPSATPSPPESPANGQPNTWPMLDRGGKDLPQGLRVRKQRLVGLFVGPIAHDGT
jgi:hypothetical protein